MKKLVLLSRVCLMMSSTFSITACDDEQFKTIPNPRGTYQSNDAHGKGFDHTMSPLIKDIVKFPGLVQEDIELPENGVKELVNLNGKEKLLKVEELFVDGVKLTTEVTNIIYKCMLLVTKITPALETIDPVHGSQIETTVNLITKILETICKINVNMQNAILAHHDSSHSQGKSN